MKQIIIAIVIIIMAGLCVLPLPSDRHMYGHIRIPAAGIHAEVYATGNTPACCGTLWNGGKVTVSADLSPVQMGDMADLRGLDGEHLVLECISIRIAWPWLTEPHGDVLVINHGRVYRFTKL